MTDDIAIPLDVDALRRAAVAGVENVREARMALGMIREAVEEKGPVRLPEGLGFTDEAEALIEAIISLNSRAEH